jgi:hypothetical protein
MARRHTDKNPKMSVAELYARRIKAMFVEGLDPQPNSHIFGVNERNSEVIMSNIRAQQKEFEHVDFESLTIKIAVIKTEGKFCFNFYSAAEVKEYVLSITFFKDRQRVKVENVTFEKFVEKEAKEIAKITSQANA